MKQRHVSKLCIIMAMAVVGTELAASASRAQPPPPRPEGEDGVLVLTRGPVHEAFAETVAFDPEPGIVVTMAPPNPIEEVPPDQRPEGLNVTWIPGYNAWDDERNDYLWVSGIWRAPPPGRQWVSGYWGGSSQGFQWISGYWGDAQVIETEYLPEPPETVEIGPGVPAPSLEHSWIPGCWIWHQGRYAWRPGYWVTQYSDWDWIPGHYTWTPQGYVFIDGYWDYTVERRGVLFAPVYFDTRIYARREYYYSPATVISLNVFSDHLFVRPRYHHYYFGDYYDASYTNAGFYSRSEFHTRRHGYDPIYVHQRWKHRDESDWQVRDDSDFRHRRDHVEARPPRTLSAQRTADTSGHTSHDGGRVVASSLDELAKSKASAIRFQAVDIGEKQQLVQRGKEVRRFREERKKVEAYVADRSTNEPAKQLAPARLRIPRSPIVAKSSGELGKDRSPPQRHQAPQPDPTVEAKPRKTRGNAEAPRAESGENRNGGSKEQSKDKSKRKSKDD